MKVASWITTWLESVVDGSSTMSQRSLWPSWKKCASAARRRRRKPRNHRWQQEAVQGDLLKFHEKLPLLHKTSES